MRLLFVLAMIGGVLLLGAASLCLYAAGIAAWQTGGDLNIRVLIPLTLILPTLLLLGAGACAGGIFMKPSEFIAAARPLEEEAKPAPWIEQMRNERDN